MSPNRPFHVRETRPDQRGREGAGIVDIAETVESELRGRNTQEVSSQEWGVINVEMNSYIPG